MAIIDKTYFRYPLSVPFQGDTAQTELQYYIDRYEKEFLTYALGNSLYDAFMAGLAEPTIAQKWLDLRDGKTYNVVGFDGKTYPIKWNGLKNTEKKSFIAFMVYWHILKDSYERFGNSLGISESENTTHSNPLLRMVLAFNDGIDLYGSVPWYQMNFNDNPEIGVYANLGYRTAYIDGLWNLKPTLFNFIYHANLADPTTYPNWVFTNFERPNTMGI